MQPMEKNVEKQLVVRTFEPDMNALKQTAKQLAHMQDTSLNLYGQAGEVLIVITARPLSGSKSSTRSTPIFFSCIIFCSCAKK